METALDVATLAMTIVLTISLAVFLVVFLDRDGFLTRRRDKRRDRPDLTRVDDEGPS